MSYLLAEFRCRSCGSVSEDILLRSATTKTLRNPPCGCAAVADRIISAPKVGTVWGYAAVRGKPAEQPTPDYMDTSMLASGDPADYDAWKAKQRARDKQRRREQVKKLVG